MSAAYGIIRYGVLKLRSVNAQNDEDPPHSGRAVFRTGQRQAAFPFAAIHASKPAQNVSP